MTETKTKLQHESKKRKKEQSESNTLSNALNARKLKKKRGREGFWENLQNVLYNTEEGPSHSARIKRERERERKKERENGAIEREREE